MYSRRVSYKSNGASSAPGTGAASVPAAAVSSGVGGGIAGHALQRGTSASYCAATQASARASPSASKGNSAKAFCVSSVFSKHQGNGHTQAESVPSVYFSRYHMPPCPPEKLLLAFKYTRPGVVTVNSSILSLRAAKQPQQNRTCCGFAWFNVLKALCASTGACALHTHSRASGGFEVIIPCFRTRAYTCLSPEIIAADEAALFRAEKKGLTV